MKFAKELERELVPEWRAKYLDYKEGKKQLKAAARALRAASGSPRAFRGGAFISSPLNKRAPRSYVRRYTVIGDPAVQPIKPIPLRSATSSSGADPSDSVRVAEHQKSPAIPETQRLTYPQLGSDPSTTTYGSIITTHRPPPPPPSALELPGPAIDPTDRSSVFGVTLFGKTRSMPERSGALTGAESLTVEPGRSTSSEPSPSPRRQKPQTHHRFGLFPVRANSPARALPYTIGSWSSVNATNPDGRRDFDMRHNQFSEWIDGELKKVETFYKMKETEATERLQVLRAQLHEMRDRRMEEIAAGQKANEQSQEDDRHLSNVGGGPSESENAHSDSTTSGWLGLMGNALGMTGGRPTRNLGKSTRAMQALGTPETPAPVGRAEHNAQLDSHRDFTRRKTSESITHRQAKRKLKLALQEYYRGLELLKSYALLNRTAFRKLNKKYDKALNARPTGRYMSEKVNKAHFVQSETLDAHLVVAEDLYARYFERGSHKVAAGKLRSKSGKSTEYYGSVYRNGLLIGVGLVLGTQGLVSSVVKLSDPNPAIRVNTSYLLQIYAGLFLSVLLFLSFVVNCKIWAEAKINYVFIFEFDTRHNMDWRQLAELPSLFMCLEGFFVWLNFQVPGSNRFYIYYPVVLIGLVVVVLFFPAPARARSEMALKWRLLWSGLYPVEFRDFFLGDHAIVEYCSQTYTMGGLVLFFCLYSHSWSDPPLCNSSNSRLLGFFSTIPGIWRGMQCIRRYYDTRNVFPHLINGGKYTFTILYYVTLSLYRIHKSPQLKALFIACASVNAVYCSIWDLLMDWSLGNPYARYPLLRDVLGFKHVWVYYAAMVLDPILRFNWVFFAIFANDIQHSALLSFAVSLSEILRRGMWSLFRMENEHCTNVGRFRASRDIPLPYSISTSREPSVDSHGYSKGKTSPSSSPVQILKRQHSRRSPPLAPSPTAATAPAAATTATTSVSATATIYSPDLERAPGRPAGTLRQHTSSIQGSMARVGMAMSEAHAQDFERRKKPAGEMVQEQSSEDDDDEDDEDDEEMEGMEARRRATGEEVEREEGQL
ncbi:MAG: hypothetical protein M1840_007344 [Geoglossum simile]|nr:MAG: hypothetical protein M1840_007344 [Geoglossum simile]